MSAIFSRAVSYTHLFSVVKSFKAEAEVVARFCRRNEELEETKGRRRRMEEVITMLGTGAGIVAQLGVFLFGAYLAVTKQGVTPGVVIVFLPLMSFVVDPIGSCLLYTSRCV